MLWRFADYVAREQATLANAKADRALDKIDSSFREINTLVSARHEENTKRFDSQDRALTGLRSWMISVAMGVAGTLIIAMATVIYDLLMHRVHP